MNNRRPGRRGGGDCRHRRARLRPHSETQRRRRAAAPIAGPERQPEPIGPERRRQARHPARRRLRRSRSSPRASSARRLPALTGTLEAGTYSFAGGALPGPVTPTDLTFTVPAGWTTDSGYVSKNAPRSRSDLAHLGPNEVFFATFPITNVFSDACHWTNTMVSAGTTVDQLTSLLVAQKGGRVASAPTNVTLGGLPAKRIKFTVPASVGTETCDNGVGLLHFWPDPDGTSNGGICCAPVGSTDVVYVLNVAGQQLVVMTRQAAGASPADLAELNAIVASIKIAAPPASPAPSGASPSP